MFSSSSPFLRVSLPSGKIGPSTKFNEQERGARTAGRAHNRAGELADAIKNGTARVVERGGRITGYTTVMAFFGHAVAQTNLDLQALIVSAGAFSGPGIIVPTRNSGLFRWCLENSLRVVEAMTLISSGLYNEPAGAYLPSVLF
jgi:hypothetical protein